MRFRELSFEVQFGELRSRLQGRQRAQTLEAVCACLDGMAAHGERVEQEALPYVRAVLAGWEEPLPALDVWSSGLGSSPGPEALGRCLVRGSYGLEALRTVRLVRHHTHTQWPLLAACARMGSLERLDLSTAYCGEAALRGLMAAEWALRLEALDLHHLRVGDALAGWVARPMERLRWLRMTRGRGMSRASAEGVMGGAPALRALALAWAYAEEDAGWLLDGEAWSSLEVLHLYHASQRYEVARRRPSCAWPLDLVLSGARGAALRELRVQFAGLSREGAGIEGGAGLEVLRVELGAMAQGAPVWRALCDAPLGALRELAVSVQDAAELPALGALLATPTLSGLRVLRFGGRMSVADAMELARGASCAQGLEVLDLGPLSCAREAACAQLGAQLAHGSAWPSLRRFVPIMFWYRELREVAAGSWMEGMVG
jgi:hypothetical protein